MKVSVEVLRNAKHVPTTATITIAGRKVIVEFDSDRGFTLQGPRGLLPNFSELMRLLWPADVLEALAAAQVVEPVLETGSDTSAVGYATIANFVVPVGKKFQINKVVVSAETAAWVRYQWDGAAISCERLLDDRAVMIEHFLAHYKEMIGDGVKAFEVQARYYQAAGTVNAEIVGEELD